MTTPDCIDGSAYTPEACEAQTEAEYNRNTPTCGAGHPTTFSLAIGACRCPHGALVRLNGTEVRSCE